MKFWESHVASTPVRVRGRPSWMSTESEESQTWLNDARCIGPGTPF